VGASRPATFRGRIRVMPALVTTGLWPAQIKAIQNLEASFGQDRPRALIQMGTGSGKTFTTIQRLYSMLKGDAYLDSTLGEGGPDLLTRVFATHDRTGSADAGGPRG